MESKSVFFDSLSVLFEVYTRGANMIPMDELEGRYRDDVHRRYVQSAVDAGMNMLRVRG